MTPCSFSSSCDRSRNDRHVARVRAAQDALSASTPTCSSSSSTNSGMAEDQALGGGREPCWRALWASIGASAESRHATNRNGSRIDADTRASINQRLHLVQNATPPDIAPDSAAAQATARHPNHETQKRVETDICRCCSGKMSSKSMAELIGNLVTLPILPPCSSLLWPWCLQCSSRNVCAIVLIVSKFARRPQHRNDPHVWVQPRWPRSLLLLCWRHQALTSPPTSLATHINRHTPFPPTLGLKGARPSPTKLPFCRCELAVGQHPALGMTLPDLQMVDEALGRKGKPPALEYILVMPFAVLRLPFGYGISYNSYGHAAVRYTRPNGQEVVMNIVGKKNDATMVQFSKPEDYFFRYHARVVAALPRRQSVTQVRACGHTAPHSITLRSRRVCTTEP